MVDQHRPTARHILGYVQTLRGGGVERALLRMAAGWVAAGRRVTLLIGDAEGPLAGEIPAGAEVRPLGGASQAALLTLAGHVRAIAPDILFCPGNHYTSSAGIAWLRMGRAAPPIVGKVSNALVRPDMPAPIAWAYRRWLRIHPLFLDHVVAMTRAMAIEAVEQMGIPSDRVSVIANPPTRAITEAPAPPLPPGRFLLGVGRLEPQKRWDRLIAALPRLADREVTLMILGEGSARAALEAQANALGIADRVLLPGYANDPLPAIARAEAVVLTSDFEGVPGVLREALALGTPVVSTDSSVAILEIVPSTGHGSVIAREDGEALVRALDHWLAPGRARPEPLPDPGEHAIGDYLALFDRIVAQRRR